MFPIPFYLHNIISMYKQTKETKPITKTTRRHSNPINWSRITLLNSLYNQGGTENIIKEHQQKR